MNAVGGIIEKIYNCCSPSSGTQSLFLISRYSACCACEKVPCLFTAHTLLTVMVPTHITMPFQLMTCQMTCFIESQLLLQVTLLYVRVFFFYVFSVND